MELLDNTRNQHFISQAEQRQNAINPNASSRNQKILSFEIIDREYYELRNNGPIKIETSLSIYDLFCFSMLDKKEGQFNFEKLFQRYENEVVQHTHSLIRKVERKDNNVSHELMFIFIAKFMNFVRNPYSIKKVLNTFPQLLDVHPTDPLIYQKYEKVLNGRKPQQAALSKELGISDQQYEQWLRIIFMLLMPIDHSQHFNFLENTIAGMFNQPETKVGAFLYTYDKPCCLLSDRGYNFYPLGNNQEVWEFNLNSKAFIRLVLTSLGELLDDLLPEQYLNLVKDMKHDISLYHLHDDSAELANFNRTTVYQAARYVLSASDVVIGL
ncbi:hypothetical protein BOO25_20510 [Vibrio navarrensis]|uniref:hypothetical protein n=1 Tax=Vibrio navarrensis TaxID=29495 RepID=UPI00192FA97E|nr:hypothetical protein [Vibrio navarrensis]MBE3671308.1 hypothetical protein [Vibrio navarrensis]